MKPAARTIIAVTIAAVCLAQSLSAQQTSTSDFERIHKTDDTKDGIWHKLKRWVALEFDTSEVIDLEDRQAGTMVIKWAMPAKISSDAIKASVASTLLIDVKDGKYRFRSLSPRVILELNLPQNLSDADYQVLYENHPDIRLVNAVSRKYYDNSAAWPVDDRFIEIYNAFAEHLQATPQFKNEKDREKGKSTSEWHNAERQWRLLHEIMTASRETVAAMDASLNRQINKNDDF